VYQAEKSSLFFVVTPVSDIVFLSFCFTLDEYNHNAEPKSKQSTFDYFLDGKTKRALQSIRNPIEDSYKIL
jgi:hypothetical protein